MSSRDRRTLGVLLTICLLIAAVIVTVSYVGKRREAQALADIVEMAVADDEAVQVAAMGASARAFLDDRISADMFLRLIERARLSQSDAMRRGAHASLWEASREPGHAADLVVAFRRRPTYIDIHFETGTERALVQRLADRIRDEAWGAGPVLVGMKEEALVETAELRCFQSDCQTREPSLGLAGFLKGQKVAAEPVNRVALVRWPEQYLNVVEVWVSKGALQAAPQGAAKVAGADDTTSAPPKPSKPKGKGRS